MTDAAAPPEEGPARKSKLPLIAGGVLALVLGAGGFYAGWSGMIPGLGGQAVPAAEPREDVTRVAFVALDPVLVALAGDNDAHRHLKFTAELEVARADERDVATLMPRIRDILNSYLNALPLAEIEQPGAMTRIRAQLLRRIQLVTGPGRVRDLLITEFVLN